MKKITLPLLIAMLVSGSVLATSADARGRHHHHGHHHHRSHIGVFVGAPLFVAPFYYPRYYYYPPAVAMPEPASAPVYIEQPAAGEFASPSAGDSGAYWHYCRDSQTYYPYVQQCASAWERVVPNSAAAPR